MNKLVKKYSLSLSLLVVSILTGFVAGQIIRSNSSNTEAASANITVTDNNQVTTQDQSSAIQTITKTSTVTIKDSTAGYGYTLSARLSQNTIPSATATIASSSSTLCTLAAPCILNTTMKNIISTTTNSATTTNGETTEWTVRITIPANTNPGNYLLDIEYSEVANAPPGPTDPGTSLGAMQSLTNASCPTTRGTAFDARNNQIYYVQKIDSLCWMESNLRYAGGGNYTSSWGWNDDRKTLVVASSSNYTDAQYADPGGSTDYANTNANGGFYGYLYNWCAAMGGQTNACNSSSTSGFDTATSICPAGWRLPTGGASGELVALNDAINSGSTSSDAGLRNNFQAVYSGGYSDGPFSQDTDGYLWSSTVNPGSGAYTLGFGSYYSGPNGSGVRYAGFAVRCVR